MNWGTWIWDAGIPSVVLTAVPNTSPILWENLGSQLCFLSIRGMANYWLVGNVTHSFFSQKFIKHLLMCQGVFLVWGVQESQSRQLLPLEDLVFCRWQRMSSEDTWSQMVLLSDLLCKMLNTGMWYHPGKGGIFGLHSQSPWLGFETMTIQKGVMFRQEEQVQQLKCGREYVCG